MKATCFSFLFLYVVLSQLFLGTLAALCFRCLVPAHWLDPLAPAFQKMLRLRWVLAPGFLLLFLSAPMLYPALAPDSGHAGFRGLYLSRAAFGLRGIAYWGLWLWLASAARQRKRWAGGPGLAALFFTATFAAVDWVLSLDSHFGSTIFGFIFFLGSCLGAFSWACAASSRRATPDQRQDWGSIHLTLICTWVYVAFIEYLVVWSGNLPVEVRWYQVRSANGWPILPALIAVFQFFLPLLLLLQKPLKRSSRATRGLAVGSVVWQCCYSFWQILPEQRAHLSLTFSDLIACGLIFAIPHFLGGTRRAARLA